MASSFADKIKAAVTSSSGTRSGEAPQVRVTDPQTVKATGKSAA